MQEALKMSRSQPVYVWILGGGAIVLGILLCFSFFLKKISLTCLLHAGICVCGYVGVKVLNKFFSKGTEEGGTAADVDLQNVVVDPTNAMQREVDGDDGHVDHFFDCKDHDQCGASGQSAASTTIHIDASNRSAFLTLLQSDGGLLRPLSAAWRQLTGGSRENYMANLEQSTAPTVEVERVEVVKVRLS